MGSRVIAVVTATIGMWLAIGSPSLAVTTTASTTIDYSSINPWFAAYESAYAFGTFSPVSLNSGDTLELSINLSGDRVSLSGAEGGVQILLWPGYPCCVASITNNTMSYGGLVGEASGTLVTRVASNANGAFGAVEGALSAEGLSFTSLMLSMIYQGPAVTVSGAYIRAYANDVTLTAAVPLPAGVPLLGSAIAVLGVLGFRKRRAAAALSTHSVEGLGRD